MKIVFYGRTTTRSSLASQTLYLTVGGRKESGVRLYVSCPSPGIVGKRTSTVLLMLAVVC